MNHKITVHELNDYIDEPVALFIGTASFESRCLTILNRINNKIVKYLFFKNTQISDFTNNNLKKMTEISGEHGVVIDLDLDKPTKTADALKSSLVHINNASPGIIFVDITTFTHEQLLIFLRVLSESKIQRKFIFGYNGADQYSTNTEPEDVWLSKGVSQIRSIMGFPGQFLPSKKLHLIMLVGFEHERAKAVIEQYEPAILTLGVGGCNHSVSSDHHATNQRFFDEVKRFVDVRTSIYSQINTFQFSGIDPLLTCESVLQEVEKFSGFNAVVCPMNTKISTLGVGLAAIKNSSIQICYSRAITYNELGYSLPSEQITVFEMSF